MTEKNLKPGWKVWRFDQMARHIAERLAARTRQRKLWGELTL